MTVRYDGSILPCCTFFAAKLPIAKLSTDKPVSQENNLHNIDTSELKNQSISDAWNNSLINHLRELHKKGEYYKNSICNECVLSTSNIDDEV